MANLFQRALHLHRSGDLAAAQRLYLASLKQEPVGAAQNLGAIHRHLGNDDQAERYFRAALRTKPSFADARHSLGMLLLARGDYAAGWPLYEARRQSPTGHVVDPRRIWPLQFPEWQGEPLQGKRLLVFGEQGLGDQIMFARFLTALRAHGADVVYAIDAALSPIFPGSIPAYDNATMPLADYWALVGSLPYRLGVTLDTLPPPVTIPVPLGSGGGIGVVPAGRPTHANDANRSLGDDAPALLALGRDLRPEATGARDFLDTARIVANLDLVITVDTSVAHLAASMGKPTWVLLPALGTDWRWLRGRSDSPWYPSARLFRQRAPGDWMGVLDEVRAALG